MVVEDTSRNKCQHPINNLLAKLQRFTKQRMWNSLPKSYNPTYLVTYFLTTFSSFELLEYSKKNLSEYSS